MSTRIGEIRVLVDSVPLGTWTIERHGDGEALYIGRDDHHHGLNIVHLVEPAYQWPRVRRLVEEGPQAIRDLLAEIDRLQAEIDAHVAYDAAQRAQEP